MSIWSHISKLIESLVAGEALSALFKRLKTPPEKKIGFTIAAIALSAKMAKADGVVTQKERIAFRTIFTIPIGDEKHVEHIFRLAQRDIAGFDIYAKKNRTLQFLEFKSLYTNQNNQLVSESNSTLVARF